MEVQLACPLTQPLQYKATPRKCDKQLPPSPMPESKRFETPIERKGEERTRPDIRARTHTDTHTDTQDQDESLSILQRPLNAELLHNGNAVGFRK